MAPVAPSRLALVLALLALGGSLGLFAGVSGLAAGDTHEFAIEDGSLVATSDGQQQTLVADVSAVDRIEISRRGDAFVVRTAPHEPATVSPATRATATRLLTAARLDSAARTAFNGSVQTVRWVPPGLSNDRAAAVGVTPNVSVRDTVAAPAFTVRANETAETVVYERTGPSRQTGRVLVVAAPTATDTRYSAVVDLRNETVDALVRVDR